MTKIKDLMQRINVEPLRQLYYEAKTCWLAYPDRIKHLIEASGIKNQSTVAPVCGRIALADMVDLQAGSLDQLVKKAEELVKTIQESGAGLVVFPPNGLNILQQAALASTGRVERLLIDATERFWGSLAHKYGLWIIAGYRTVSYKGRKHMVCYCFDPTGKCNYQLKTHLSAEEKRAGYRAGRLVKVWETGAGPVAVSFAGEEQYFELARIQAAKGAKIIIRLGEWEPRSDIKTLSGEWARAQENNIYYVSGSQIFLPSILTIDGSGVITQSAQEDLPFMRVDLNLDRLSQAAEDAGATPLPNKDLLANQLPHLVRGLSGEN